MVLLKLSKKYATTQLFKINQSSLQIKGLVVLHAVAIIATIFNGLAVANKLIIFSLILISLFVYIKNTKKEFILRFSSLSGWTLAYSEKHFHPITVLRSTVITPYFIFLHFKMQNQQKHAILIFIDALKGDEFRMLEVELKLSGLVKDDI